MLAARALRRGARPPRAVRRRFSSYDVLGIAPDASQEEAKAAYRALAKRHHPDAPGGDAVKFREATDAWERIETPAKRAAYDESARASFGAFGAADPARKRARANAAAADAMKMMGLERLLGPGAMFALLVFAAGSVFFSGGRKAEPRDTQLVRDCWRNPASGKLEPPAPWDPLYLAAKRQGGLVDVPRCDLGVAARPR